jgi:hypothetical protein
MVRELARMSEGMPAGDWMDRQRCVRRGLVRPAGGLSVEGRRLLQVAIEKFRQFEARHGR